MSAKKSIKKSALAPTVLIAGGAGFIGSKLAEALLKKGSRVVVVDNFSTGKRNHVKHLLPESKFALYDVDINEGLPQEIESVDYIFHLAGLEEYLFSRKTLNFNSLLTNSVGTKTLLDLAEKSSAKFLLVSTVDVYEGVASDSGLDNYFGHTSVEENKFRVTESKRFAEAMVWEHYKKFETNVRIVRLPEVYGPGMDLEATGFLGPLLDDLLHHRDLKVYGDERRQEYYLHINDAVSGLVKAMFKEGTRGEIYSLVGEEPVKLLKIAFMLRSLADRRTEIGFAEGVGSVPSATRSVERENLKKLEWSPEIGLKSGVVETLESFDYKPSKSSFKPADLIREKLAEKALKRSERTIAGDVADDQSGEITKVPFDEPTEDSPESPEVSTRGIAHESAKAVPAREASKKEPKPVQIKVPKAPRKPLVNPNAVRQMFIKRPGLFRAIPGFGVVLGILAVVLSALLVFVIAPVLSLKMNTEKGLASLESAYQYTVRLDSESAQNAAQDAVDQFSSAQKSFASLRWLYVPFGGQDQFSSLHKLLSSVTYLSKSVHSVSTAIGPFSDLWEILRPDSEGMLTDEMFDDSKLGFNAAKNYAQLAEADFKYVDIDLLPSRLREPAEVYDSQLARIIDGLNTATLISSELPQILGTQKPQKYLVLFQNSNELRATGGFIGSYGVLEFDKGKITNLLIDDIYNPDGQIDIRNIRVAPPGPVATFLAEDRMYLRNSNWNPDFVEASKDFQDLFFKIDGSTFDGAVALDLHFAQNLLSVIGSVYLAQYDEEITAENLYERAQFHSDFNYQDGSSQKKNFLTVLGGKLLERLFSLPQEKVPGLLSSISTSLDERHLLMHFSNNSLNAILKEKGWDGSLVSVPGDYLYVVNSNLGGTKANYYVENSYDYAVFAKTRDGLLRSELTLNYNHTGQDESWPGGPYKDYVRVLVPKGTYLTSATTYSLEKEEEDIFKIVKKGTIGTYDSYEFSFTLNPRESVEITLGYDLPKSLSVTKDSGDYSLYWQKQPGTHNDAYTINMNPPFGMEVVQISPGLSYEESLTTSGFLNKDVSVFVKMR
jgi:nucleoside-diphosphate-sugar epimerase